jgi:DNA-binding CsgD family transcriptional regulator
MRSENAGWRAAIVAVISAYKGAVRGPLTKTEREIARLIADGHTSKEVAELSSRSVLTVESHVRSIIAKLGGGNRRTAIRRASELGWL